jgi:bleomycin hydrolase
MKLKYFTFVVSFCFVIYSNAQNNQNDSKKHCDIACSSVKNQGNTGTCWSFAGCSFLESEIFRIQYRWIDLSEMYIFRQLLKEKAFNYIYRQGKAQFGEGGLNEDVLYAA